MRNPKRIPQHLERIRAQWEKVPDWRLGQLIVNAMFGSKTDLSNIEDNLLIEKIETMIKGIETRKAAQAKTTERKET